MWNKDKLIKFAYPFIIFTIFLLGFFLRAQETLSGNYLFLLDQGRDMMAVKQIVFDHKLTLIGPYTSLQGVFQGPIYFYLLAIPTLLLQGNPWGGILLMLIISLAVMAAAFYFINKEFGNIAALVTLVLFAVSPEAITAATYIWNPHPMWFIMIIYIFLLYETVKEKRIAQIALWPIIGLSFHFEMAFGVFLFSATLIYFILFKRKLLKNRIFWISLLISIIFFFPQIIFELRHDFLMTKSVFRLFQGSNQGLLAGNENSSFFASLDNNFGVIRNNFISAFIPEIQFSWLLGGISIVIGIYGWLRNKLNNNEKILATSVGLVLIIIILLSLFYPFRLRYWFLTGFQSFYIILTGIFVSKIYSKNAGKFILLLFLGVILFHSAGRIGQLYFYPPNDGGFAKIKGKIKAIDYIYEHSNNKKFGLNVFTPPVLTDAYDYLIWWHGSKKYGFIPYKEKKGTVFLLMEPDSEKPWSYKGWLETVIKTGIIINTTTLPTGLIIQEREF